MADEARDEEPFGVGRFDPKENGEFLLQDYPEPVLVVNDQGRISYWNRAADALLMGEVKDRLEAHLRTRPDPEGPEADQVRIVLAQGGEQVLQLTRAPTGWQGEAAEVVAVHDVTRQMDAVQEIKAANCRYVAVLDGLPVANYVVLLDEGPTTLFVSPRFEELLGYPRDSWSGEKTLWRRFIHEDERDAVLKDFERCIENEKRFSAEYRVVTQNGDHVWVREESRCVEPSDGKQPFLVGILMDISKDKKSEEELSKYRDFLEQQAMVRAEELDRATARLQEETSRREALEKEAAALRERLERAETSRQPEAETRARLEELERANETLENELRETRARLEQIEGEAPERSAEAGVEALNQTIDQLREEIAEARRIEAEVKAGRDHVAAQARARIEELERQVEALRAERDEFERTAVELKAGREHAEELARKHLAEFRDATMALREELEAVRPRAAELESACAELTSRSETLTEENGNLRAELEQEVARREEAEARIGEIQKQLDDTRWYEGELKARYAQLEGELRAREEELERLCEQLENEARLREETEGRVGEIQKQLDDTRWHEGQLRGRYKELESELQAREDELRELRERLDNEALLRREADERIAELRKQLDETRWYEGEWRARAERLEGELDEARRLVEEARAAQKAAEEGGTLEIKKIMEQYEQATVERQRAERALEAGLARLREFDQQFRASLQPAAAQREPEENNPEGDGLN